MSSAESNASVVSRDDIERLHQERAKDRKRIAQLEETVENLQAQIDALEERAPDPERKQYEEMDKSDKATVVKEKLKRVAQNTDGRAQAKYKTVIEWFDGHPSPGHAYDIMKVAGMADGYNYGETPDGTKRLTYTE